jgi:hypothetical protein
MDVLWVGGGGVEPDLPGTLARLRSDAGLITAAERDALLADGSAEEV